MTMTMGRCGYSSHGVHLMILIYGLSILMGIEFGMELLSRYALVRLGHSMSMQTLVYL